MSQRVKRPNRSDDGSVPVKKRKRPAMAQEEEETSSLASWRPINDLKIYNRSTTEAPAELFRKDLISAMKLPDSEPLASDEYWVIVDQWKQEWERGVQVPVNPDSLPEPSVTVTHCAPVNSKQLQEFKPPKVKYIRITKDDNFKPEEHYLSTAPAQSEAACSYDLDECDVAWLKLVNNERLACGLNPITEDQLERVIERLELRCWDKIQAILRNEEGLGIEYDENVICDVCRSPDSEEGNEMVFCDSCNICVHQACYGITRIPEGQWLCCTCTISQRPECVLCPNKGGAMKCTRSGQKWAHVSCALWIPEVSIGCVEKMEPITKISSIPQSRWALICVLCRERVGACIQCSVKTCKTAYHVTCAFKHGLEMRAIIEDENADDGVKLRSYCEKHSKSSKKEKSICSGSEDDDCKRKKRKDMTSEEKNQARAARLQEIETEFFKHVSSKDIAVHIEVDAEALQYIYNYWKLKRKAGNNRPLLPPKSEDVDMLSHKQEQADLEKMKMFVQLRQDLERVRNLCYMVSRREKLSRTFFRMREQTFHKQVAVLQQSGSNSLNTNVVDAIMEANHGPSIYDRLYSHNDAMDHANDFDTILARIAGVKSPPHDSSDERKPEINGLFKDVKNNPYKKLYFNGASKRRSGSLYGSSLSSAASSSDERPKDNKENRLHSSSEDEEKPLNKKRQSPNKNSNSKVADRRRKRHSITHPKFDSSSEEDIKPIKKEWQMSKSRLKQIESELGVSASDSDDLMPINKTTTTSMRKAISSIYSDSDSSDLSTKNDDKSSNAASDSQSQSKVRTKAAVKEFSNKPSTSKSPNKSSPEVKKKGKESTPKKDASKKKDYVGSDLIVPQRQAAKKASENLKSTTTARANNKDLSTSAENDIKQPVEEEKKEKTAHRKTKAGRPPKDAVKEDVKVKEDKSPKKEAKKVDDLFDAEKEVDNQDLLAYVPQRQAAKKAAEHIKSGLGKPTSDVQNDDNKINKKDVSDDIKTNNKKETAVTKKDSENKVKDVVDNKSKAEAAKVSENKRKSSSNSSTSSSSSSSSDTSSSSSSDSEDDRPTKAQSENVSSPRDQQTTKRTGTKDWPFLDKAAKSAASTSSTSDSSDSSRAPSPDNHKLPATITNHAKEQQQRTPKQIARSASNKFGRKGADKKSTPSEREEHARSRGKGRSTARGRPRTSTHTSDRVGDAHVRAGDIVECAERNRNATKTSSSGKGKSDGVESKTKEATKSKGKLFSPVREAEKKLNADADSKAESELGDLEKEILERKAASNKTSNKSMFDRLFGPLEHKQRTSPEKTIKSPVKEVKETPPVKQSTKKSPVKTKSIDDIFANKLSNAILKSPEQNSTIKKKEECDSMEHKTNLLLESTKLDNEQDSKTINKPTNKTTQSHSIFSPNPHHHHNKDDIILDDFDILDDDFGISKDVESVKLPLTFSIANSILFKEDTKEDSARETLNLVEKLRMGLSKKSTGYDVDDALSVASSINKENERLDFTEQIVPNHIVDTSQKDEGSRKGEQTAQINLKMRVEVTEAKYDVDDDDEEEEEEKAYNKFISCEANVQMDMTKRVPENQHVNVTTQSDERWVPPSENYPNLQAVDEKTFNEQVNEAVPSYMQQQQQQYENQHNSPITTTNLAPIENRLQQDDLLKNESPNMHDRRVTQTPFLEPPSVSMDCMQSPSPYADLHPQAKWAESHVMPTRRSSSSSAISTASNLSRRNDVDDEMMKRQEMLIMNHPALDGMQFGVLPFPPNAMDTFPQYTETNPFANTPVSLFPPTNINTQIPFPSPGAALFPPPFGASFPTPHSVIPPLPKPMEEALHFPPTACTAAFTSSQHNMALTAAMVNLPAVVTPAPKEVAIEEKVTEPISQPAATIEPTPPTEEVLSSPALSNSTPNHVEPSPNPSLKSNSSTGKKSPSKPTRTSARFISQNKSPSKSPGKSPRQELNKLSGTGKGRESKKGSSKASTGRGTQSQARGRGRGRGRGRTTHTQHDFDYANANTIHNKLVGTVYDLDFDDDMSNEMGDLRAMRERRKSADLHEQRKSEMASRDSSESPKFTSPAQKSRTYSTNLSELRPPTPISEETTKIPSPVHHTSAAATTQEPKPFANIVQPVLPGPVDMRTYNSTFDNNQYNETNLLGAFREGVVEQPANEEFDEYFEKELQGALTASHKKPEEPHVPEVSNIKVSLSDSRNQLKVKIKGPIANYTSSVAPLPPANDTTITSIQTNSISNNLTITNVNSANINSGASTNLRRMRKKELLRQYCSQDMNMDDPSHNPAFTSVPVAPINRTIITIPKAVASMTSIPTKDDYRDYRTGADDLYETKIKKEKATRPSLSRELRQLDIPPLDEDNSMERRRSIGSNNSNSNFPIAFDSNSNKRRGRPPRPAQTTPKLKIKISSNSIVGGGTTSKIDDKKDRIRPPKKRLSAAVVKPSVEDLRRESMKFRKQVMADFGEEKKEKKKKDKSNKKSKKKKKQDVQIVSNEMMNTTKLIIRFGKKTDNVTTTTTTTAAISTTTTATTTTTTEKPNNIDNTIDNNKCEVNDVKKDFAQVSNNDGERTECVNLDETSGVVNSSSSSSSTSALRMVRTNKTPIKLKLSRCLEGSGYVMKTPPSEKEKTTATTVPPPPLTTTTTTSAATLNLPEPPPPVHTATPLPLNKDCEVR